MSLKDRIIFNAALQERLGYIQDRMNEGRDPLQTHRYIQLTASLAYRLGCADTFIPQLQGVAEKFYRAYPEYAIKEKTGTTTVRKARQAVA